MMTFDEFITKYLGKKVDFDGYFQGQCVDLFRQYIQDVLGTPQPKGVVGAKNFWTNYETDPALNRFFEKIPNTITGVPMEGDVIIWDAWTGNEFGHVAMFIDGNASKFTSLDQNYPTLSVVTKTEHTYLRPKVLGWLRPIKHEQVALKDTFIDWDDEEGHRHEVGWYVREWYSEKTNALELEKCRAEAQKLRETNAKMALENTTITGQNISLMERNKGLTDEVTASKETTERTQTALQTQIEENTALEAQLDACKDNALETLTLGSFVQWIGLKIGRK